jgi:hypothetical protein
VSANQSNEREEDCYLRGLGHAKKAFLGGHSTGPPRLANTVRCCTDEDDIQDEPWPLGAVGVASGLVAIVAERVDGAELRF